MPVCLAQGGQRDERPLEPSAFYWKRPLRRRETGGEAQRASKGFR